MNTLDNDPPGTDSGPTGTRRPSQPQPVPNAPVGHPPAGTLPGGHGEVAPLSTPPPEPKLVGPAAGFDSAGNLRRRRVGTVWVGLIAAAVFLILLVVFIAQNQTKVSIRFFGFSGLFPLGLTVLIASVVGVLIAAIPGSVRIVQLRRALKHNTPGGQRNLS